MFDMKDRDYKCPFSEDTLNKAKKELGEKPETRLLEVNTLRSRVVKTPGLKPRTDINFLLPFLRCRKFDQERAYKQIKSYYEWRKEKSEVFDDLKPSRIKNMLDSDMMEVLKGRDKQGCRIVIWRAAKWDEDRFPATECLKLYATTLLNLQQGRNVEGIISRGRPMRLWILDTKAHDIKMWTGLSATECDIKAKDWEEWT